jgi:hypothetical protein
VKWNDNEIRKLNHVRFLISFTNLNEENEMKRRLAQAKAMVIDQKKDKIMKAALALLGGLMAAALFSTSAHAHVKSPRAFHAHEEDDIKPPAGHKIPKFNH